VSNRYSAPLAIDYRGQVPRPPVPRATSWAISIACLGGAVYAVLIVVAMLDTNVNMLQALTVAPLLVLFTVPIALRIARMERDRTLASIIMAGVIAKLLGALIRYYVAFTVYNGDADATQYDIEGRQFAAFFRRWDFDIEYGKVVGTGFIRILTGVVYSIFGSSKLGGFLVFAWIGFLGLLLFWRAFRIGVPTGDGRRYMLLVLLLPSLLYWPSSIGKEAWVTLGLGISAVGIASLLRGRGRGVVWLVVGLLALGMVRPHVGLVVFAGLVFAVLIRRAPPRTYLAPLMRIFGLVFLLVVGVVLAGRTASFLGVQSLTQESVETELSETETQTEEGGSRYTPVRVSTPLHLPPAFVTVFFRPFPFEAGNLQGLLSSGEGLLLVALCIASRKRLRSIPEMIRTTPYLAFSVGYVLVFVYALSSFSNFGILARQRVQALPLLLVPLALPVFRPRARKPKGAPLTVQSRRSRARQPVQAGSVPVTSTSRSAGTSRSSTGVPPPGRRTRRSTESRSPSPNVATGSEPDAFPVDAEISRDPRRPDGSPRAPEA
jgi:hypothetical protein